MTLRSFASTTSGWIGFALLPAAVLLAAAFHANSGSTCSSWPVSPVRRARIRAVG